MCLIVQKLIAASKMCCILPGLSIESIGFNMPKTTIMMAATSSCITMKFSQGRACAVKAMPKIG